MKLNSKRIKRKIIGLNFTAIFFFLLSSISFTFAWFVYSSVVQTEIEIGVSAWHIELRDGEEEIWYELSVPISEFYPGMDKYIKSIEILNKGDIDAEFDYKISSLRILEKEYSTENQEELHDTLAQDYPFLFNIEIDSQFIGTGDSIMLNIVADWPLDSGDDAKDSMWGITAYNFNQAEQAKAKEDPNYKRRSVIEISLELNTRQYVEDNENITDNRYLNGNIYNFNIETLEPCNIGEDKCYNFYVIDKHNLKSDETVKFILSPKDYINEGTYEYVTSLVTDSLKLPTANQIMHAISRDIIDTSIVIPDANISNRILGNIAYNNRDTNILNDVAFKNGYIQFSKSYFNGLSSNVCYWTSTQYNENMNYAIMNNNEETVKLYGEDKNSNCLFVPVIEIKKEPYQE